jgi:hypothetical protein
MSEAIDKFFHRQIPVMKIMELLINLKSNLHGPSMLNHSEWLDNRAQVALKSTLSSRQDKIIALELIGASLHSYVEEYGFVAKFMSWREAMTLRYFYGDVLPKTPDVSASSAASSVVFETTEEFMSTEDLYILEEHFKRDVVGLGVDYPDVEVHKKCIVELRFQSLLVIRRIGNLANHGPSFYIKSLYDFVTGKIQDDNAPFAVMNPIVFNTFLLILEQTTKFDPTLLSRKSFDIFIKTLNFASRFFAILARKPP